MAAVQQHGPPTPGSTGDRKKATFLDSMEEEMRRVSEHLEQRHRGVLRRERKAFTNGFSFSEGSGAEAGARRRRINRYPRQLRSEDDRSSSESLSPAPEPAVPGSAPPYSRDRSFSNEQLLRKDEDPEIRKSSTLGRGTRPAASRTASSFDSNSSVRRFKSPPPPVAPKPSRERYSPVPPGARREYLDENRSPRAMSAPPIASSVRGTRQTSPSWTARERARDGHTPAEEATAVEISDAQLPVETTPSPIPFEDKTPSPPDTPEPSETLRIGQVSPFSKSPTPESSGSTISAFSPPPSSLAVTESAKRPASPGIIEITGNFSFGQGTQRRGLAEGNNMRSVSPIAEERAGVGMEEVEEGREEEVVEEEDSWKFEREEESEVKVEEAVGGEGEDEVKEEPALAQEALGAAALPPTTGHSLTAPDKKQDTPTSDPTPAPITNQDSPTPAPIANQDSPTPAPIANQDSPTPAAIANQDGPTPAPIASQGSPAPEPAPTTNRSILSPASAENSAYCSGPEIKTVPIASPSNSRKAGRTTEGGRQGSGERREGREEEGLAMRELQLQLREKDEDLGRQKRGYERDAKEREEQLKKMNRDGQRLEREKWELLKRARDGAERSLHLQTQLDLKEGQLRSVNTELERTRDELMSVKSANASLRALLTELRAAKPSKEVGIQANLGGLRRNDSMEMALQGLGFSAPGTPERMLDFRASTTNLDRGGNHRISNCSAMSEGWGPRWERGSSVCSVSSSVYGKENQGGTPTHSPLPGRREKKKKGPLFGRLKRSSGKRGSTPSISREGGREGEREGMRE